MSLSSAPFPSPAAGQSTLGQNDTTGALLKAQDEHPSAIQEILTRVVKGAHESRTNAEKNELIVGTQ